MLGKDIRLKGVTVRFGSLTAVAPLDLTVRAGEFFGVLGPSGSGKTTLLRAIGGFVAVDGGRVHIGGADVTDLPPEARPTAVIFQNLALFPLMTVAENVSFGLEARGIGRGARDRRVAELLELVALEGLGRRFPHQLSGAQRQRVAVARALAVEPSVLLLDEPLSALDLRLKHRMREELRELQRRTGVTFLYITHDQSEVLAMADRIAVMNEGRVDQVDTPDRLYSNPDTAFVAAFIGEQNQFEGRVSGGGQGCYRVETPLGQIVATSASALGVGDPVVVMVRPERVSINAETTQPNQFEGELTSRRLEGATVVYTFRVGAVQVTVQVANIGLASALLASVHRLSFAAECASAFPRPARGGA